MRASLALLSVCVIAATVAASAQRPADVAERAKKSERVVIATVSDLQPRFDTNQYGDRLIVSRVWLDVDDTLKGDYRPVISMEVEGGTVGDLTLRVSDLPTLRKGQHAVFFLERAANGTYRPHDRGRGILAVDANGHVADGQLTLADVKAMVAASTK